MLLLSVVNACNYFGGCWNYTQGKNWWGVITNLEIYTIHNPDFYMERTSNLQVLQNPDFCMIRNLYESWQLLKVDTVGGVGVTKILVYTSSPYEE